ncbi:unnamed protein product [Ascophyllum nodosum]
MGSVTSKCVGRQRSARFFAFSTSDSLESLIETKIWNTEEWIYPLSSSSVATQTSSRRTSTNAFYQCVRAYNRICSSEGQGSRGAMSSPRKPQRHWLASLLTKW